MSNLGAPLDMKGDDEERVLDDIEFADTELDLSEEEIHAELTRPRRDLLEDFDDLDMCEWCRRDWLGLKQEDCAPSSAPCEGKKNR